MRSQLLIIPQHSQIKCHMCLLEIGSCLHEINDQETYYILWLGINDNLVNLSRVFYN